MRKIRTKLALGIAVVGVVSAAFLTGRLPGFGKVTTRVDRLDGGCAGRVGGLPLLSQRRHGRNLELSANPETILTWSPDYLVALSLEIDRQYLPLCPSDNAFRFSTELKREYLRRLGHPGPFADVPSVDRAFRVFLATGEDFATLSRKLASDPAASAKISAEILTGVTWPNNPSSNRKKGIPLLGATPEQTAVLEKIIEQLGSIFFDARVITQVRLTDVTPMAAFVASTGTLVLSRKLLDEPNDLHRLVVAHELAHSAVFYARWILDEDWVENFAPFSHWTPAADGKWNIPEFTSTELRQDTYTQLSENSPFSLLPDPVLVAPSNAAAESFVFARAYREKNPEEDLADAMAAWKLAPERFCHAGAGIASLKYRWVGAHAFGANEGLKCSASPVDPPTATGHLPPANRGKKK